MPRSPSVSSRCSTPSRSHVRGQRLGVLEIDRRAERRLQLAAIRLEDRRAAIREEIPVLRIDDDRNSARARRCHRVLDHARHQHALVVVLEHERVRALDRRCAPRRARRSTSAPSRSPSSSSSTRTTCCARATMRVFVVVGRSTVDERAESGAPIAVEHRAQRSRRPRRRPTRRPVAPRAEARRRSARRSPRRRARSAARARERPAPALRARSARRRRGGRRRASRRRPRRSRRPAAASSSADEPVARETSVAWAAKLRRGRSITRLTRTGSGTGLALTARPVATACPVPRDHSRRGTRLAGFLSTHQRRRRSRQVLTVQEYFVLAGKALRFIFARPFYVGDVIQQMDEIGVKSLGIVLLTGFFTGMVLALQSSVQLKTVRRDDVHRPPRRRRR